MTAIDTLEDKPLTGLQQRFVEELVRDPSSAVRAYKRAGGKGSRGSSSRQQAARLMADDGVKRALREARVELSDRTQLDAAWIIRELRRTFRRCSQRVAILDSQGEPSGVYKFDSASAVAALRVLQRYYPEAPKAGTTRTVEEIQANLITRLGLPPDHFAAPTEADFEEMRKVGAVNFGELRALTGRASSGKIADPVRESFQPHNHTSLYCQVSPAIARRQVKTLRPTIPMSACSL